MDITLSYTETEITYTRAFSLLKLKGMDDPDKLHKIAVLHDILDGGLSEQVRGFLKVVVLSFKPPITAIETRFLVQWFLAAAKRAIYLPYVSEGITDKELLSEWLFECEHGRTFDITLHDEHVYTAWSDGVTVEEIMYLKREIKIEGTEASPETFTTNSGKLATDETGQSYPAFSNATHVFLIALNAEKNCQATFAVVKGSVAVVTGNLTFQAFVSDYGSPASDGFFYSAISIFLQAR